MSIKSLLNKFKKSKPMGFENNNYIHKNPLKPKWNRLSLIALYYIFVISISILVYWNSINGEFVHDDLVAIVRNPDVTEQNPIMEVFVHDFWGREISDPRSHKSYRPFTTLSFR